MAELATITRLHPEPEPKKRSTTRRGFGAVRKLPSGRFQARYLGPDGKTHTAPKTFQTKTDTNAWLAKVQREMVDRTWKPPAQKTKVTLAEYAADWVAKGGTRGHLSARTEAEYSRWLERLVLPELGGLTLDRITPEVVESWHQELCPEAPTQRARVYSMVSSILGSALPVNPCQVKGAGVAKSRRKITPATMAELAALMDAVPDRYQAAIVLAGWCALRFGEVTELRRADLDLEAGEVTVARGVTWVPSKTERWPDGRRVYQPVVGDPKSEAGKRPVAIPPHVLPVLRRHLQTHTGPGPEALLFPARKGGHLRYQTLTKVYYRAREAAGRPDLSLHQLRHTAAVLAAQAGATLKELMERLGHGSSAMALRYQHVAAGRQSEISRRMSELAGVGA